MKDDNDDIRITPDDENVPRKSGFGKKSDAEDMIDVESGEAESAKALKEKLRVCMSERQEYLTGWQRAKADFVNARAADEKSRAEFVAFSKESVISELLPVLDSFDLAMANKEAWEKVEPNWRKGVEYIYQQLRTALEAHGLSEVNPIGQSFNPMEHTAIEKVHAESPADDGKIVEVSQKGYALNKKVVRSPKVKVAYI